MLSLQREIFVASAERNEENQEVTIYLWDVRQYSSDESPFLADPMQSVTLEYKHGPAPVSVIVLAFAPNERFLAIRKDHDLTLLTVPDLEIYTVLPMAAELSVLPDELNWSADSKLVAFRIDDPTSFVVWNIETDEKYHRPILDYGPIMAVKDGWIVIPTFLENSETAFWSCTLLLEQCTQHSLDGITPTSGMPFSIFAAPQGQFVLMTWGQTRSDINIWVWRRQENGNYRLFDTQIPGTQLGNLITRPVNISPDGQYIVTFKDRKPHIWDSETFNLLQTIGTSGFCPLLSFFPNSKYLVNFCGDLTLALYEIGKPTPIDSLGLHDLQMSGESMG